MWAALRPKAVAEPHEVGLIDSVQHLGHRALDDLVLQSRNAKRAPPTICFRDVRAAHRFGPILSAVWMLSCRRRRLPSNSRSYSSTVTRSIPGLAARLCRRNAL